MQHLEREAKKVIKILISTNCCSFYLTLKATTCFNLATERNEDEEEANNSQEELKERPRNVPKKEAKQFPMRRHHCRICNKKWTIQM
jgi:hypothetical protein